jgi:transcriptional regulator with XRE-family HTH domain
MLYDDGMSSAGRRPQNSYSKSGQPVDRALRHLREQRGLTRGEVVELVADGGGTLSEVYLAQVEAGDKRPSEEKLDVILDALGSSRPAFEDALQVQPWNSTPAPLRSTRIRSAPTRGPQKMNTSDLRNSAFYQTIGSKPSPSVLGSIAKVEPHRLTGQGLHDDTISALHANQSPSASLTFGAAVSQDPVEAEVQEISAAYRKLSRDQQLTVLGMVRHARNT